MSGKGQELRKVFVKTYGCQMNVYDSERMTETLLASGYMATESPESADLIVLNTCHIREKAAEKVYSELGRMRRLKEAGADAGRRVMIGVAGCVAQAEGAEILPARRRSISSSARNPITASPRSLPKPLPAPVRSPPISPWQRNLRRSTAR